MVGKGVRRRFMTNGKRGVVETGIELARPSATPCLSAINPYRSLRFVSTASLLKEIEKLPCASLNNLVPRALDARAREQPARLRSGSVPCWRRSPPELHRHLWRNSAV